jgi:hypothetical protein
MGRCHTAEILVDRTTLRKLARGNKSERGDEEQQRAAGRANVSGVSIRSGMGEGAIGWKKMVFSVAGMTVLVSCT